MNDLFIVAKTRKVYSSLENATVSAKLDLVENVRHFEKLIKVFGQRQTEYGTYQVQTVTSGEFGLRLKHRSVYKVEIDENLERETRRLEEILGDI